MNAIGEHPPADLYITAELHRRAPKVTDYLGEKLALQDLAAQMPDHPEQVLPKLVEKAMQVTGAASAGISVFEPEEGGPGLFRWRDLRGALARFDGATTPRDDSPCGVCLDRFEATLARHPERHYGWIAAAGVVCPEVLLVPLFMARGQPLGTLWVVAEEEGRLDSGHARVLEELASFAGIALAMAQDRRRLQEAAAQQETLAAEMSHRVKNLFAVVDALISITRRSAGSAAEFATILSGRLHALAAAHALVREGFGGGLTARQPPVAGLRALTEAILRPYRGAGGERFAASGEDVRLGAQAATGVALVLHELATNAAKYGALSCDAGHVSVRWERHAETLAIEWREAGGPPIGAAPGRDGVGSDLARQTILRQFGGTLALQWREAGLLAEITLPLAQLAN